MAASQMPKGNRQGKISLKLSAGTASAAAGGRLRLGETGEFRRRKTEIDRRRMDGMGGASEAIRLWLHWNRSDFPLG